ncbi:MAG: pseudouridine synthase [Planctomycetota bacterium]
MSGDQPNQPVDPAEGDDSVEATPATPRDAGAAGGVPAGVPADELAPEGPAEGPAEEPAPEVRILHLDDDFVAVSKPSGLLVHRDEHHPDAPAALQLVRDLVGRYVYPFHRLDRATSGILLFGFSSDAAAKLQKSLSSPDAHKEYAALMRFPGSNRELGEKWTCDRPLADDKGIARDSRTDFELLEAFDRCALVQCRIYTGRYHQIRRHANHSGRHILGDTTHGKGRINALCRERFGLHRLFLHLGRVQMSHPISGERLLVEDPMPQELLDVLDSLRQQPPKSPPSDPTSDPIAQP